MSNKLSEFISVMHFHGSTFFDPEITTELDEEQIGFKPFLNLKYLNSLSIQSKDTEKQLSIMLRRLKKNYIADIEQRTLPPPPPPNPPPTLPTPPFPHPPSLHPILSPSPLTILRFPPLSLLSFSLSLCSLPSILYHLSPPPSTHSLQNSLIYYSSFILLYSK